MTIREEIAALIWKWLEEGSMYARVQKNGVLYLGVDATFTRSEVEELAETIESTIERMRRESR